MNKHSVLLLLILLAAQHSPAQERVITVSPKVGSEIDSSECAQYQILKQFRGLRKAVVFQAPDSTYRMVVTTGDSTGGERDSSFAVTGALLHVLFSKIEYREALKTGAAAGAVASSPFLNQPPGPGDLPFGSGPSLYNEFPRLGFSVGISSLKPKLVGLENAVHSIVAAYRAQGYAMRGAGPSPPPKMPLTAPVFGLSGAFSSQWRTEIQVCVPSGGDVNLSYVSLAATYTPAFLSSEVVRLGCSAGILRLTHELTHTFGFEKSESRISLIDPLGRYAYLSSVRVMGSGTQWAGSFALLGEIHRRGFALISVLAQYTVPSTFTSKLTMQGPVQVPLTQVELGQYEFRLEGFSAGLQLTIHF